MFHSFDNFAIYEVDNKVVRYLFPFLYLMKNPNYYENFVQDNSSLKYYEDEIDEFQIIFPNISYQGKMFHYDDFPKIDYSKDFKPEDGDFDFFQIHVDGIDASGHTLQ